MMSWGGRDNAGCWIYVTFRNKQCKRLVDIAVTRWGISHHILGLGTACGQGWYHWKSRRTTYLGLEIHANSKPRSAPFLFRSSVRFSQSSWLEYATRAHPLQSMLWKQFFPVQSFCWIILIAQDVAYIDQRPLKLDVVLLESFEYYMFLVHCIERCSAAQNIWFGWIWENGCVGNYSFTEAFRFGFS